MLALCLPAGEASGQDRPLWEESPQLFVMTGFIANSTGGRWGADYLSKGEWSPAKGRATLAAWAEDLASEYDAEKTVRAFRDAGATGVIFYDKWHDGFVNHDSALTEFKTGRDLLGETAAALRKYGMKIVVYYSAGLDYNPEARFLEWACRDSSGKPMGMAYPGDWMSLHSPYRKYLVDQLAEIVNKYGPVHGLWLDFLHPPLVSYDQYTQKAFREACGKRIEESTPEEQSDFVIATRRDVLQTIRKAVPGVQITFNGAGIADRGFPKSARLVDTLADWFSMEGHSWSRIDRGSRVGRNLDRPLEVGMLFNSSWFVPMDEEAPPASMSVEEAVVSAATAWTQGANVYAAMTPGHSGVYSESGDLRLLKAAGSWLRENRKWLGGTTAYADIGILRGSPDADLAEPPSLEKLWASSHRFRTQVPGVPFGASRIQRPGDGLDGTVRKLGYLSEFVGSAFARRPFDLNSYRLLILPENAPMSGELADDVRAFVAVGGAVLAFGHASLFDSSGGRRREFALHDVFGANFAGALPGYKQLDLVDASGMGSDVMRLNPGALAVRARAARTLATWRGAGDAPAIIENRFGKGRSIYVSAEESAAGDSPALFNNLIVRLIGLPAVSVRGKREYALVVNRKDQGFVVHLLNRSTGSRAARDWDLASGPPPALSPEAATVTLDTRILGEVDRVELLPDGKPIAVRHESGIMELSVNASPAVTSLHLIRD